MGDACQIKKIPGAYVQENGIIRKGDGRYIGRLDDIAFEDLDHTREPLNPQIENNFSYHSPKPGQPEIYQEIREKAKELAYLIDEKAPNSREKSLAMTKLEEAVMWANAAIARN